MVTYRAMDVRKMIPKEMLEDAARRKAKFDSVQRQPRSSEEAYAQFDRLRADSEKRQQMRDSARRTIAA